MSLASRTNYAPFGPLNLIYTTLKFTRVNLKKGGVK